MTWSKGKNFQGGEMKGKKKMKKQKKKRKKRKRKKVMKGSFHPVMMSLRSLEQGRIVEVLKLAVDGARR